MIEIVSHRLRHRALIGAIGQGKVASRDAIASDIITLISGLSTFSLRLVAPVRPTLVA